MGFFYGYVFKNIIFDLCFFVFVDIESWINKDLKKFFVSEEVKVFFICYKWKKYI